MYSFKNDYSEGAHPLILQKLAASNEEQQPGYGEDSFSVSARSRLREEMQNDNAAIYFVSGGTQANLLVISYLLRPHEAVISARTGHIYANETGAIESTGHRIITVETDDGKVAPAALLEVLKAYHLRPHVVKPRMLYISNSTEIGTVYTKAELSALFQLCNENGLLLFLDGARLGHALTADTNDLTLADVAAYTHVFYVGGTKNGALLGEAIVFQSATLAPEFDYNLKQKGALLAKGRLLGIQFDQLFADRLYFRLAHDANQMAYRMATAIEQCGYPFLTTPVTNQLFPILPRTVIDKLAALYSFYIWKTIDNQHDAIRIITSWATQEAVVEQFCRDFKKIHEEITRS